MISAVKRWKKSMPIPSTPKPPWSVRRSPAAPMRWRWRWPPISAPAMSFTLRSAVPMIPSEEVIGIRPCKGSLAEFGITYRETELLPDGTFDYENIRKSINEKTKLVTIQRSKGYATRPTFSVQQIGELICFVKELKPGVICMVDNCYGEFTEIIEPSDVGADMIVGSLIKNPGGGLAPTGGYICGTQECVDQCAYRLTAPRPGRGAGRHP